MHTVPLRIEYCKRGTTFGVPTSDHFAGGKYAVMRGGDLIETGNRLMPLLVQVNREFDATAGDIVVWMRDATGSTRVAAVIRAGVSGRTSITY